MATTPKQPESAKAPANPASQTPAQTPSPIDREAKLKLARTIATRAKKWGKDEAQLFLGAILAKLGCSPEVVDAACAAAEWNGAVVNCSAFGQWADGTAKEPDRLGLGFKLRGQATEERAKSISDLLAGL
jgi:hypothetical protein